VTKADGADGAGRWARLRFSIVGPLLAAPPGPGELATLLAGLAGKEWLHPTKGTPVRFAASTLQRWYYTALKASDPIEVLRRRLRKDTGEHRAMTPHLRAALRAQYDAHTGWSMQLHADNLRELVRADPSLGPMPSYPTVRRYMRAHGLVKVRRKRADTPGAQRAAERLASREVRSYEAEFVNGLWHADFHVSSRPVLTREGRWAQAYLLGILDDYSRRLCHGQFYLSERTEVFVHGTSQAGQKCDLPGAYMTDNGSAMTSAEFVQGLERLSIVHETTLPYSPYQNAKMECFWGSVEGRFMPMLEGVSDLTLDLLNEAFQAWAHEDYNRKVHSEIGVAPLERFLAGKRVGRPCPSSDDLRRAFRLQERRKQRRSDGTVSIEGRRYEVPSRYRHLETVTVRYARWDLASVDMVDPRAGTVLCPLYPLDKARNADAQRRLVDDTPTDPEAAAVEAPAPTGIAPLLRALMAKQKETGLPPAYLPKEEPLVEATEPETTAPETPDPEEAA
jgi:transposase InsO family protein